MDNAPDAGDCLLEVATVEPEEESIFYHPLPKQAMLTDLRVEYTQDDMWRCDTESDVQRTQAWPAWHETLAPGSCRGSSTGALSPKASSTMNIKWGQKSAKGIPVPVQVRQLKIRGVICEGVLFELAETDHLDIFRNQATQSILEYAWLAFVRRYFSMQLFCRIIELAVLIITTVVPGAFPAECEGDSQCEFLRRASWSLLFVSGIKETVCEACQAYGFIKMGEWNAYFGNVWTSVDTTFICLFNVFVFHGALNNYWLRQP